LQFQGGDAVELFVDALEYVVVQIPGLWAARSFYLCTRIAYSLTTNNQQRIMLVEPLIA
jgi:hypothetical protein